MMLKKESLLTQRNAMDGVSEDVKHRHIRHCYKVIQNMVKVLPKH